MVFHTDAISSLTVFIRYYFFSVPVPNPKLRSAFQTSHPQITFSNKFSFFVNKIFQKFIKCFRGQNPFNNCHQPSIDLLYENDH